MRPREREGEKELQNNVDDDNAFSHKNDNVLKQTPR